MILETSMSFRLSSVRLAAALAIATGFATAAHADDSAALAAAAKEPGAMVTASGLVFRSLVEGKGVSPRATSTVKVNYKGSFVDGTKFDASADHGGAISFPLNGVIPCWTEGVQKLKVGGKAKLTCPSAIAYGANGAGSTIPPNTTLVFEVELLGVK
jgi:FKBP-type peptidyl-prolyl cis-trans isomerase FkpA